MISLKFLDQFGTLLEKSLSSAETYSAVFDILDRVIEFKSATLFITAPSGDRLEVAESRGPVTVDLAAEVPFLQGEGLSGWVASQRGPVVFSTVRRDRQIRQFCSLVSIPLWFEERLLGVLNLGHKEPGYYRQEDKPGFQKLAGHLSLIVEQLRLRDEIRDKNFQLEKLLQELQTTQTALVEKERLAAIGEVVVRIKHEINNPLSIIIAFTDLLSMQCPEDRPEFTEALGKVKEAAQRIEHITKALEKVESSVTEEYLAGVKMLKIE